jgi:hypothetical protein
MSKNEFQKAYKQADTWGDADDAVAGLSVVEKVELTTAIECVEDYFGADAVPERIKFYFALLRTTGNLHRQKPYCDYVDMSGF